MSIAFVSGPSGGTFPNLSQWIQSPSRAQFFKESPVKIGLLVLELQRFENFQNGRQNGGQMLKPL